MLGIRSESKPDCVLSSAESGVGLGVDTWLFDAEPQVSWEHFPGFSNPAGLPATREMGS